MPEDTPTTPGSFTQYEAKVNSLRQQYKLSPEVYSDNDVLFYLRQHDPYEYDQAEGLRVKEVKAAREAERNKHGFWEAFGTTLGFNTLKVPEMMVKGFDSVIDPVQEGLSLPLGTREFSFTQDAKTKKALQETVMRNAPEEYKHYYGLSKEQRDAQAATRLKIISEAEKVTKRILHSVSAPEMGWGLIGLSEKYDKYMKRALDKEGNEKFKSELERKFEEISQIELKTWEDVLAGGGGKLFGSVVSSINTMMVAGLMAGPAGAMGAAYAMEAADEYDSAIEAAKQNGFEGREAHDIASAAAFTYGMGAMLLEPLAPMITLKAAGGFGFVSRIKGNKALTAFADRFAKTAGDFRKKGLKGARLYDKVAEKVLPEFSAGAYVARRSIYERLGHGASGLLTESPTEGAQFLYQEAVTDYLVNGKDLDAEWFVEKINSPGFRESWIGGFMGSGYMGGITLASHIPRGARNRGQAAAVEIQKTAESLKQLMHAPQNKDLRKVIEREWDSIDNWAKDVSIGLASQLFLQNDEGNIKQTLNAKEKLQLFNALAEQGFTGNIEINDEGTLQIKGADRKEDIKAQKELDKILDEKGKEQVPKNADQVPGEEEPDKTPEEKKKVPLEDDDINVDDLGLTPEERANVEKANRINSEIDFKDPEAGNKVPEETEVVVEEDVEAQLEKIYKEPESQEHYFNRQSDISPEESPQATEERLIEQEKVKEQEKRKENKEKKKTPISLDDIIIDSDKPAESKKTNKKTKDKTPGELKEEVDSIKKSKETTPPVSDTKKEIQISDEVDADTILEYPKDTVIDADNSLPWTTETQGPGTSNVYKIRVNDDSSHRRESEETIIKRALTREEQAYDPTFPTVEDVVIATITSGPPSEWYYDGFSDEYMGWDESEREALLDKLDKIKDTHPLIYSNALTAILNAVEGRELMPHMAIEVRALLNNPEKVTSIKQVNKMLEVAANAADTELENEVRTTFARAIKEDAGQLSLDFDTKKSTKPAEKSNKERPTVTPKRIESLKPNEVFVFGSNLAGRHGKGAALTAKEKFGAKQGVGEGLSGQSYALPTKDRNLKSLDFPEIHDNILKFIKTAIANPDKTFYLTPIGTGLAKKSVRDMADVVNTALSEFARYYDISNIVLPEEFQQFKYYDVLQDDIKKYKESKNSSFVSGIVEERKITLRRVHKDKDSENITDPLEKKRLLKKADKIVEKMFTGEYSLQEGLDHLRAMNIRFGDAIVHSGVIETLRNQLKAMSDNLSNEEYWFNKTIQPEDFVEKEDLAPYERPADADKVKWARKDLNGYEVSTRGDKRFSALVAKLADGRTIEEHYQIDVKGYSSVAEGKGKPPKDKSKNLYNEYLKLWKEWAKQNPALIEELREKAKGKTLTDVFAKTDVSQARALADILNETNKPKTEAAIPTVKAKAKTRLNILETRRTPLNYTTDQLNALTAVSEFLDSEDGIMIMAGYAGTGKTTIAENIATYVSQGLRKEITLAAPTNIAKEILALKLGAHERNGAFTTDSFSTMHSLLWGEPDPKTRQWNKVKDLKKNSVIIIDESSMVTGEMLWGVEGNPGIIELAHENDVKLIFIGDSFQLPPVSEKSKESIYEDSRLKENSHKYGVREVELSEVKRTDNSILDVATHLRTERKPQLLNIKDENFSIALTPKHMWEKLEKTIKSGEKNFIVITFSNPKRLEYNKTVRQALYGYNAPLLVNDERLISVDNAEGLSNGTIFNLGNEAEFGTTGEKVEQQLKGKNQWRITGKIKIRYPTYNKGVYTYNDKSPYLDVTRIEYVDADGQLKYLLFSPEIAQASFPAKALLNNEEWLRDYEGTGLYMMMDVGGRNKPVWTGGAFVTYAYALTAHKSQGQEFDHVFINSEGVGGKTRKFQGGKEVWLDIMTSLERARWMYTAITRGKKSVTVVSSQTFPIVSQAPLKSKVDIHSTPIPSEDENNPFITNFFENPNAIPKFDLKTRTNDVIAWAWLRQGNQVVAKRLKNKQLELRNKWNIAYKTKNVEAQEEIVHLISMYREAYEAVTLTGGIGQAIKSGIFVNPTPTIKHTQGDYKIVTSGDLKQAVMEILGKENTQLALTFVDEIESNPEAFGSYSQSLIKLVTGKATREVAYHEAIHWTLDMLKDANPSMYEELLSLYGTENDTERYKNERATIDLTKRFMKRKSIIGRVNDALRSFMEAIKKLFNIKDENSLKEAVYQVVLKPKQDIIRQRRTSTPITELYFSGASDKEIKAFESAGKTPEASTKVETPNSTDDVSTGDMTQAESGVTFHTDMRFIPGVDIDTSIPLYAEIINDARTAIKLAREKGETGLAFEAFRQTLNVKLAEHFPDVHIDWKDKAVINGLRDWFVREVSKIPIYHGKEGTIKTSRLEAYLLYGTSRNKNGKFVADSSKMSFGLYGTGASIDPDSGQVVHIQRRTKMPDYGAPSFVDLDYLDANEAGVEEYPPRLMFLASDSIAVMNKKTLENGGEDTWFTRRGFLSEKDIEFVTSSPTAFFIGTKRGDNSGIIIGNVPKWIANMTGESIYQRLKDEQTSILDKYKDNPKMLAKAKRKFQGIRRSITELGADETALKKVYARHIAFKNILFNEYYMEEKTFRDTLNRLRIPLATGFIPYGLGTHKVMVVGKGNTVIKHRDTIVSFAETDGMMMTSKRFMRKMAQVIGMERLPGDNHELESIKMFIRSRSKDGNDYAGFKMMNMVPLEGTEVWQDDILIAKYENETWVDMQGNEFDHLASDNEAKQVAGKFKEFGAINDLSEEDIRVKIVPENKSKATATSPVQHLQIIVSEAHPESYELAKAYEKFLIDRAEIHIKQLFDTARDPKALRALLGSEEISEDLLTDFQKFLKASKDGKLLTLPSVQNYYFKTLLNRMIKDNIYTARGKKGDATQGYLKPKLGLKIKPGNFLASSTNAPLRRHAYKAFEQKYKRPPKSLKEVNAFLFTGEHEVSYIVSKSPVEKTGAVVLRKLQGFVPGSHGDAFFFTQDDISYVLQADFDGDKVVLDYGTKEFKDALQKFQDSDGQKRRNRNVDLDKYFGSDVSDYDSTDYSHAVESVREQTRSEGSQGAIVNDKAIANVLSSKKITVTFPELKIKEGVLQKKHKDNVWQLRARNPEDPVVMKYIPVRTDKEAKDFIKEQGDEIVETKDGSYLKTTHENEMAILLQMAVDDVKFGFLSRINYDPIQFLRSRIFILEEVNIKGEVVRELPYSLGGELIQKTAEGLIKAYNYSPFRHVSWDTRLELENVIAKSKDLYFQIQDKNQVSYTAERVLDNLSEADAAHVRFSQNDFIAPLEKLLAYIGKRFTDYEETMIARNYPYDEFITPWKQVKKARNIMHNLAANRFIEDMRDGTFFSAMKEKGYNIKASDYKAAYAFVKESSVAFYKIYEELNPEPLLEEEMEKPVSAMNYLYNEAWKEYIKNFYPSWNKLSKEQQALATAMFITSPIKEKAEGKLIAIQNNEALMPTDLTNFDALEYYAKLRWEFVESTYRPDEPIDGKNRISKARAAIEEYFQEKCI